MSDFEYGSIILDEERNVYYAGQVLVGKIEFKLNQPLVFRAITIEFHGEASVRWEEVDTEEYNGVRRQRNVIYSAKEQYFNVEQCICGGVEVSQLAAGSHSIPFRYQIPNTCPSSFDGSNGDISYWVKARLDFPDGREPVVLEKAFELVVPLDFNFNQDLSKPMFLDVEEVLGSWCCGSGPLSLRMRFPGAGFCPGQTIPIEVSANNQSSVEITKIIFEFTQRESYHSIQPASDQICPEKSLGTVKSGPVMAKTKREFTCNVRVPDMIAPVLQNCDIIKLAFFLKVKLKINGCNEDIEDETEIYLGLVPLHSLVEGNYKHPLQNDLPKSPPPDPNAPSVFIPPEIYPSVTLENSYPVNKTAYPTNTSHPQPGNAPYPGAVSVYPANSQYPGANTPYPGANTPYPGANTPYPGSKSPYPTNSPSTNAVNPNTAPSPVPASGIGFRVPGMPSPGYPPGPVQDNSPYNPSAPPAP